jgi:phage-related protein
MPVFPYLDIDDRVQSINTWPDFDQSSLVVTYNPIKRTENKNTALVLGDGYKSQFTFGLNSARPSWDVEIVPTVGVDSDDVETFFTLYCAEENSLIHWTPPDSDLLETWRIDEWTASQQVHSKIVFGATLRRVYELGSLQFQSEEASCPSDALCDLDLGLGFSGLPVKYFTLGFGGSRNYAESPIDTDGTTYGVHGWSESCYGPVVSRVNKIILSGQLGWTKQYKCSDNLQIFGEQCGKLLFDSDNNLWLIFCSTTSQGNTSAGYYDLNLHFLRLAKFDGSVIFSKSFKIPIAGTNTHVLAPRRVVVDSDNNWYVGFTGKLGSDVSSNGKELGVLIKFSSNLVPQWGKRWFGIGASFFVGEQMDGALIDMCMRPESSRLHVLMGNNDGSSSVSPLYVTFDTGDGTEIHTSKFYRVAAGSLTRGVIGRCIDIDNKNNLYIGVDVTNDWDRFAVFKFSISGQGLVWAKGFYTTGSQTTRETFNSAEIRDLAINPISGRIAVAGTSPGAVIGARDVHITEISENGDQISMRTYYSEDLMYYSFGNFTLYSSPYDDDVLTFRGADADHVTMTYDMTPFNYNPSYRRQLVDLGAVSSFDWSVTTRTPSGSNIILWPSFDTDITPYAVSFVSTAPDLTTPFVPQLLTSE